MQIPLDIMEGKFVDFSTSRNVMLDWVDRDETIDFYLPLDANDEIRVCMLTHY